MIEILLATVVIGILASISVVTYTNALDRSRQKATMADMRVINKAIEAYSVDHNILPDDSGGLIAIERIIRPYTNAELPIRDQWGNAYSYEKDADGNYTLESFGKDGRDGIDYAWVAKFDFDQDLVLYNGIFVSAPVE